MKLLNLGSKYLGEPPEKQHFMITLGMLLSKHGCCALICASHCKKTP